MADGLLSSWYTSMTSHNICDVTKYFLSIAIIIEEMYSRHSNSNANIPMIYVVNE